MKWEVGLCGIGGSRALSRPIHEYLLDGENEIGVIVNPGDTPRQSNAVQPPFNAGARRTASPPDPAMNASGLRPPRFTGLDKPKFALKNSLIQFINTAITSN